MDFTIIYIFSRMMMFCFVLCDNLRQESRVQMDELLCR